MDIVDAEEFGGDSGLEGVHTRLDYMKKTQKQWEEVWKEYKEKLKQ